MTQADDHYVIISFELTNDWEALYKQDDGTLEATRVDAIALCHVLAADGSNSPLMTTFEAFEACDEGYHRWQRCSEAKNYAGLRRLSQPSARARSHVGGTLGKSE